MSSNKKNIAIVGSGVAGLATAVRLAYKGHDVTVFERDHHLGGKMGVMHQKGYRFDTGPSLFTQPYLMDEIVRLQNADDSFDYKALDITCRYFWEDGTVLSAYANKDQLRNEVKRVFPEEEAAFFNRLDKAKELYKTVGHIFIEKPLNQFKTWFSKDVLKALMKLPKFKLNSSMHQRNQQDFKDEKLVQLFDRFATYNGSNPHAAPALLNMIPHLEFNEGAYYPKGGLRNVPETLILLGKKFGVQYKTNAPVEEILHVNDTVIGLKSNDETYLYDIVVSNADVYPTYKHLLPNVKAPKKVLEQERSSSGVIFYWGINKSFSQLDVHNILFSESYKEEFENIFEKGELIDDPTLYINITSKVDASDAVEGGENWFILVNAPANKGQDWDSMIAKLRKTILQKVERILGENIEPYIDVEELLDPRTIESKTSSYQGSLYGTSSNNKYAAFLRHTNDHSKIKGLYFCGGSVHPGGGIPLCLNSAKIVSELIS